MVYLEIFSHSLNVKYILRLDAYLLVVCLEYKVAFCFLLILCYTGQFFQLVLMHTVLSLKMLHLFLSVEVADIGHGTQVNSNQQNGQEQFHGLWT